MAHGEDETNVPVTQIVNESQINKLRFLTQTICKLSSPDNKFIDQIIACLSLAFRCEPTSPVMYNHEMKQFYVFLKVAPREA